MASDEELKLIKQIGDQSEIYALCLFKTSDYYSKIEWKLSTTSIVGGFIGASLGLAVLLLDSIYIQTLSWTLNITATSLHLITKHLKYEKLVHENKQLADKFHKLSSEIQELLVKETETPENTLKRVKKEFLDYEDTINDIIPEWIKNEFSQKYPRASLPIKLGGYSTIRLPERLHLNPLTSRHRTLSIQEVFPPPIIVIPPSPTPPDKE